MSGSTKAFVGIDASLRSTGLAVVFPLVDGVCTFPMGSLVKPPEKLGEYSLVYMYEEFSKWLDGLPTPVALAAIEGPSINSQNRPFDMGAAYGVYKLVLMQRRIPFTIVPPKSLKKYFTGKGTATKEQMFDAQKDQHPTKCEFAQNDMVDAYALALLAQDVYEGKAAIRKRHKEEIVQQACSTLFTYAAV